MAKTSDFIGKDADKDCLTPQMGVFWGWMKNIQFLSEAVSVEQAIKDSKRENSLEKYYTRQTEQDF